MIALQAPVLLDIGIPITLANGVAAAQNTPGSGVLSTNPTFTVSPRGDGDRTLALNARGTGAVPTTATGTLWASSDGGTSWQIYAGSLALVATTTTADQVVLHLVAGLLYQLLLSALTLGSATAVSVDGAIS